MMKYTDAAFGNYFFEEQQLDLFLQWFEVFALIVVDLDFGDS